MSDKLKADVLSAFNGGEITPELSGRVDKEELKFGTRYVSNFLPTHQGGLKKWYGTSKVATVTDDISNGYRMIPFSGASEPLALLFCNGNVYAVSASEVFLQDFTIPINQIADASYLQINDLIYFTEKNTGIFQIQYYGLVNGHHRFRLQSPDIKEEPFFPISWAGNYNKNLRTTGYNGIVNVEATSSVVGYMLKLPERLQNAGSGVNVLFGDREYNCITAGDIPMGNNTYPGYTYCAVNTGLTSLQLIRKRNGTETTVISYDIGNAQEIKQERYMSIMIYHAHTTMHYADSYGVVKMVSESQIINAFASLGALRIEDGYLVFSALPTGHLSGDEYKIRLVQAASSTTNPDAPVNDTVQGYIRYASANAYTMDGELDQLDEISYLFDSTDIVGRKIRFRLPSTGVVAAWAQNVQVTQNKVYYSDGNYYVAKSTGTTGTIQPVHRQGTVSDGAIDFEYLHSGYGVGTIISVPDTTHLTIKVDGNLPVLDISLAQYDWDVYQWSMWGYHGKYPSNVFTFANRLGYTLDTDGYGSWLQMSKTDDYADFGTEEYGKQLDTCGINIVISGHPDNRINWVLSGYRLYMGSASGEYNVLGDKSTGAMSPVNVQILPVSNVGGARVDAVKYKDMNIFVGTSKEDLFRLQYDYSSDDYVPDDLSTVSENLFEDGVAKMQVLRSKDRNLYFLTDNKRLRLCSVQEEIKTVGCYRVDVSGDVLDFATSNAGVMSSEFLLVKRDDVCTVEIVDSASPTYMLSTRTIRVAEEDPVIASTITDLEFAGKEIFVQNYEDGMFYHIVVGSDGTFANRFSTRSLAYGLPLVAEVHTLPSYNQNNKLEGLQQKAIKFNVRLLDSGAFSYGSSNDFDQWYEYHNWNTQSGQEWNEQHKLMSGDLQLPAPFGYMQVGNKADGKYPNTTGVAINLRAETPEPFNLLMVSNLYV